VITQELLDELWDFGDPAGSERRLASEAASQAHTDAERAELLTQQARALGLQERFGAGGRCWNRSARPPMRPSGRGSSSRPAAC
jgi:hypothetical protein